MWKRTRYPGSAHREPMLMTFWKLCLSTWEPSPSWPFFSLAPEFPDVKQLPAILDAEPGDTRFGPARLTVVSGASGAYFGDIKRVFGVPKEIVLVANPRQIPAIQRKLVEEHIKQMEQVFDDVKLRTSGDVRVKERGRPDAGDAADAGDAG